jgi:amino acid adenylation domain-containing protein
VWPKTSFYWDSTQIRALGASVTSNLHSFDRPVAITGPQPPAADGNGTSAPAECVGPIAIRPDLTQAVRALSAATGADDFVLLTVCATVLARRLSGPSRPLRARVIQGAQEAVTPPSGTPVRLSDTFRAALRRSTGLRVATVPDSAEPVDLTILVSADGRRLYVETMTSSADVPFAHCCGRTFVRLLTGLVGDPDAPMDERPLIDDAERDRILHGLNPYRAPEVGHRTMAEPFEEQAGRTPDAVALLDEHGGTLTYRELNERANRLAHFLIRRGAGPGTRIGVHLHRGIAQIVALYAAVKAGAAYVPLDTELPDNRLEFILGDAAPGLVLTDPAGRDRLPDGVQVVDVESDSPGWAACPATNPDPGRTGPGLLHILYTSGTTGRPKGVAYPTTGALAHLSWMQGRYPYGPGDAAVFKTSPGFDVSIWEIFWPLYQGACLVICDSGRHRDPRHLARLVEDHPVSTVFLPPTVLTPFLTKVSAGRAGRLRRVLCGGEPITARVRDTFHATLPAVTLVNCYGPTEAGNVTDMPLPVEPGVPVVPLGRPAANFRIVLLDDHLGLVPAGMPGEAYIGGEVGLAYAYWRAPGRTAERFVADPYGPPGSRLYRTGDLCRYRDDGVLEHLGRIDRQIKIRGLRIEPGEIESVLVAHPAVGDCAVVAHGDPARLIAFVVSASRSDVHDLDAVAIGEHAAAILPRHMQPERIVPVLRIPATVNGKIDQAALIALWQGLIDSEREIVPPADELEAALVALYRRVLDTDQVSVLDTFTELGGHSLLAFTLLEQCQVELSAQPDVAELITGTVRDVAASIRAGRRATGDGGAYSASQR